MLIVLYVGSQLASTLMATATADPNQRRLMLLLPLVFVVILYRYPAGLLVYWITTNMWTIGQQYLIKRRMGHRRPAPSEGPATGARGQRRRRIAERLKPERSRAAAPTGEPALAGGGAAATRGRRAAAAAAQEEEALGQATMSDERAGGAGGASDEELEPAEALEELLEEIVDGSGLDVEVEVEEGDGVLTGRARGRGRRPVHRPPRADDRRGAAPRAADRVPRGPASVRVVIDANGYRERRAEALRAEADDAAEEALRSGEPVELDPLPPFERRIVHEYLRERGDVETHSEGDEPERYLVVSPARAERLTVHGHRLRRTPCFTFFLTVKQCVGWP